MTCAYNDSQSHLPQSPPRHDAPIYFILHIPKCAGRTIDCHLAAHAPDGTYHQLAKRRGPGRFLTRYDPRGMPEPSRLAAVGGHSLGRSLERYFAGRQIRRTVLLRDPVSHAVSYYNFRMMRYLAQGCRSYGFELAYRSMPRNFMVHFLLGRYLELPWPYLTCLSAARKYALANQFLSSCWFVGDYTRCDQLIAALAPELRIPPVAVRRNTRSEWERRVPWGSLGIDDLPIRVRNRIRQENMLDQMLWQTWRDAGHDTALMRPRKMPESSRTSSPASEFLRPVYQTRRRWRRGWT